MSHHRSGKIWRYDFSSYLSTRHLSFFVPSTDATKLTPPNRLCTVHSPRTVKFFRALSTAPRLFSWKVFHNLPANARLWTFQVVFQANPGSSSREGFHCVFHLGRNYFGRIKTTCKVSQPWGENLQASCVPVFANRSRNNHGATISACLIVSSKKLFFGLIMHLTDEKKHINRSC